MPPPTGLVSNMHSHRGMSLEHSQYNNGWSPVGCMCAPCVKKHSPVMAFREPLGNSLVLFQALRALFPSWDIAGSSVMGIEHAFYHQSSFRWPFIGRATSTERYVFVSAASSDLILHSNCETVYATSACSRPAYFI